MLLIYRTRYTIPILYSVDSKKNQVIFRKNGTLLLFYSLKQKIQKHL